MTVDVRDRVARIVSSVLKVDTRDPDQLTRDNFPEWDSLSQLEIVFSVEEEFGVSLDPEAFHALTSVVGLVDAIDSGGG